MFRFSTRANVSCFAARAVLASVAMGVLTALCYTSELNLATTSLLLLLVVVIQAIGGGFASSMLLSLLAAGILDHFFVPPVLTWRISDPFDSVALTTFVTVALIITRLASGAREEACKAETRRRILERMYEGCASWLLFFNAGFSGPKMGL